MASKKTPRERIEENKIKIAKLQDEIRKLEKQEREIKKREDAKNLSALGKLFKEATGKSFDADCSDELLEVLKNHFGKGKSVQIEKGPPIIDE